MYRTPAGAGTRLFLPLFSLPLLTALCGCFSMRDSRGGGELEVVVERKVWSADVALPPGYRIEPVTTGLTFPSGVAFDGEGRVYVVETGYAYGEVWTTPRLLRVESQGQTSVIATGGENGPWNGVAFHNGDFFVAEGGRREGGRLLRITPSGNISVLVDGLPTRGDHHANGPVMGPDGWLYFSTGTATNSGVVGDDNIQFGWVKDDRDFHDVPCEDVRLTGRNFKTEDPFDPERKTIHTGAFVPLGTKTAAGQVIAGRVPCSGAVLRVRPEGGPVELVAWGFRNPFGLAFAADGRLFVTDNGYDVRGSRPVHGAGDLLWEVRPGTWYGWPDFSGRRRLDDGDHFEPPGGEAPGPLLLDRPPPPEPAAILAVHSSSDGIDFSPGESFGFAGQAFVAQFGDQAPVVGKVLAPVGYKVVRVDVATGVSEDFAANKGKQSGPATWLGSQGLERPVAVRFDPAGEALYVVDFGVVLQTGAGTEPQKGTGVLWRIRRDPGTLRGEVQR